MEIPTGTRAEHTIEVSPEMTVDFGQQEPGLGKLHEVYATYWLAKHFELVSRKLTLPYLGEREEGIGFEVSARHLAPTLPGMSVALEARLDRVEGNRVHALCRAVNSLGELVGVGSTTQVVLDRGELEQRFASVRGRVARLRSDALE